MTIKAEINKDSVGPNGVRLTTFVLSYPRFIHSEFMTHRVFSRNASSSRAVPFEKQVKMIEEDPAMPIEFRENKKGMQAGPALTDKAQEKAKWAWLTACDEAIGHARKLNDLGVHKQYVNRLVEPFAHISVVVSATEYANFFALRHHNMAQPEIAELAKKMWDTYSTNEPERLETGEWHLPFVTDEEIMNTKIAFAERLEIMDWLPLIKSSVARCARVSYLNHDGTGSTLEQDCVLYDRLLGSAPIHASPAEHQARAIPSEPCGSLDLSHNYKSGNFHGWVQYRKTLEGENIISFEGPLE